MKASRRPRPVGDLLPEALPQLTERLAEARLRQSWDDAVGADVARRARPGPLADGCLTVVVDNSPWLHELNLRQSEVLLRIRARCPSVRSLRLTVGPLPTESPAPRAATAPSAAPLSDGDRQEIEATAAAISDAALAAAARRALTRARQATGAPGRAR